MNKRKNYDNVMTDSENGTMALYGWNLDKDKLKEEVESWRGNDVIIHSIEEMYYYTTQWFEGSRARDEGFSCWVEFESTEFPRPKNRGKCTYIDFENIGEDYD